MHKDDPHDHRPGPSIPGLPVEAKRETARTPYTARTESGGPEGPWLIEGPGLHEPWVVTEIGRAAELGRLMNHAFRTALEWTAGQVDSRPFPIQAERTMPDIPRSIPWWIAERAYREYSRLYGDSQSLERLAERGGFAWAEIGVLLAADLQRHPQG